MTTFEYLTLNKQRTSQYDSCCVVQFVALVGRSFTNPAVQDEQASSNLLISFIQQYHFIINTAHCTVHNQFFVQDSRIALDSLPYEGNVVTVPLIPNVA